MLTKASDMYSAGLLALRCWSNPEVIREGKKVICYWKDEDVRSIPHAVHALDRMLSPCADHRIKTRVATMLPLFWSAGTISQFFADLNYMKNDELFAEIMDLLRCRHGGSLQWIERIQHLPIYATMRAEAYYENSGRSFIRFMSKYEQALSKSEVNKTTGDSGLMDEFIMDYYAPLFYELFELFVETGRCVHYFDTTFNGALIYQPIMY